MRRLLFTLCGELKSVKHVSHVSLELLNSSSRRGVHRFYLKHGTLAPCINFFRYYSIDAQRLCFYPQESVYSVINAHEIEPAKMSPPMSFGVKNIKQALAVEAEQAATPSIILFLFETFLHSLDPHRWGVERRHVRRHAHDKTRGGNVLRGLDRHRRLCVHSHCRTMVLFFCRPCTYHSYSL